MSGTTRPITSHNARLQLTATAISNVGVGFIIIGVLTPFTTSAKPTGSALTPPSSVAAI